MLSTSTTLQSKTITRHLSKKPNISFLRQQALKCDTSGQGAGYGICCKGVFCWGVLPNIFQRALAEAVISMSQAELSVSQMAMVLRSKHKKDSANFPIVIQNNNTAAIDTINQRSEKNLWQVCINASARRVELTNCRHQALSRAKIIVLSKHHRSPFKPKNVVNGVIRMNTLPFLSNSLIVYPLFNRRVELCRYR